MNRIHLRRSTKLSDEVSKPLEVSTEIKNKNMPSGGRHQPHLPEHHTSASIVTLPCPNIEPAPIIAKSKEIDIKYIKNCDNTPNSHPLLLHSKKEELKNFRIFIATLIFLTIWAIVSFKSFVFHFFFQASAPSSPMKAAIKTVIYLLIFSLIAHRIFGYISSLILRKILRQLLTTNSNDNDAFDIHIGWASYRGFLDYNQIILHDIMWRNPVQYNRTPFLLRIKDLSISLNPISLYSTIKYGTTLEFDMIVINEIELYFERPMVVHKDTQLNVWNAFGIKTKSKEKELINNFFMFIVQKIKNKLPLFRSASISREVTPQPSTMVDEDDDEEESEADVAAVNRRQSTSSKDSNSSPNKALSGGSHRASVASNSSIASMTSHSSSPPVSSSSSTEELKVELNLLVIRELRAHVVDLLSNTHVEANQRSDIHLRLFAMTRDELTGSPLQKGAPRRPLTGSEFGDKFGEKFAQELVNHNLKHIVSLFSSAMGTNIATTLKLI